MHNFIEKALKFNNLQSMSGDYQKAKIILCFQTTSYNRYLTLIVNIII